MPARLGATPAASPAPGRAPDPGGQTVRLATWEARLTGRGPGLVLDALIRGRHDQALAALARLDADIVVLTGIDHDPDHLILDAVAARLRRAGADYPHRFAAPPNSGVPTGLDLDGDGITTGPDDAQGYGHYRGQRGVAILSRFPIERDGVRDLSGLLWSRLPDSLMPSAFYPAPAREVLRLSSTGHWLVPLRVGGQRLTLLVFAASSPVFDGPEDRNGRRNADEIRLWQLLLDGRLSLAGTPLAPPQPPFVVIGRANLDPFDGEGRHQAIRALLADPRLQDPAPAGPGGQAHAGAGQIGPPAQDTADLPDPRPGNLRLSYILPSASITVRDAFVAWPATAPSAEFTRHYPVVVDITLP